MAALNPPDAVIVATARSPIGRAVKGSLRRCAPTTSPPPSCGPPWTRCPSSTRTTSTTSTWAAACPAASRASTWPGWSPSCSATTSLPGATLTRYCASSLQTTRMAFHAIKAGEGDVFISAGVETVSRYARGNSDGLPPEAQALVGGGWENPRFADGARAVQAARGRRRRPDLDRPARRRRAARRLPGHGADRREPGPGLRRDPRGDGRVRRTSARTSPRRPSPTASGPARSPRSPCPTARWSRPTTAPARVSRWRASPASSRCSAPTAGSPPATAARSTTAPPR